MKFYREGYRKYGRYGAQWPKLVGKQTGPLSLYMWGYYYMCYRLCRKGVVEIGVGMGEWQWWG